MLNACISSIVATKAVQRFTCTPNRPTIRLHTNQRARAVNKPVMMAVGLHACLGAINKAATSTPEQITFPMRVRYPRRPA